MTPLISAKLSDKVAIRPRVAMALAVANRTIPALAGHRDAMRIIQEALADGPARAAVAARQSMAAAAAQVNALRRYIMRTLLPKLTWPPCVLL